MTSKSGTARGGGAGADLRRGPGVAILIVVLRWLLIRVVVLGGLAPAGALAASPAASYTNPIGGAITMGDPFVLWNDGRFFLYGTTAVNEGFKCWSSSNLLEWSAHGLAYRKRDGSWAGKTFWAPEVFNYRGRFYMVFSAGPPGQGPFSSRVCLAVSERPEGPYEDFRVPLLDNGWNCIDGHVFVDGDGPPFLYFAKVGTLPTAARRYLSGMIFGVKLKADLSGPVGEPVLCTQADQPWELPENGRSRCNEGAFVFKHGDTYYLTYSANHYAEPFYGIGYATAKSPLGPWTKSASNPLVSQKPELGISGPGHNCVIRSPDGKERIMVYHTHADPQKPGGRRVVNLDRLIVQDDGRLKLMGPTRSPQPLPSGL